MKIALVSPYPPSKGTLNEYAYHLVEQFQLKKEIDEIVLITDKLPNGEKYVVESKGCPITVCNVWEFNKWNNPLQIVKTLKKNKVDVAIFNIQFLSFGDKRIAATLGLLTPLLSRLVGIPSLTLLHNIIETVDFESAGITSNKLLSAIFRTIGTALTALILASTMVAVTMPKYVDILRKKYRKKNIALMPHGSFQVSDRPNFQSGSEKLKVMTFGKFGTYKKVEEMIEAVELVRQRQKIEVEIEVAGTDNPNVKGYLKNVKEKYKHIDALTFSGYIEEENVPKLFSSSTIVVFPYTSTTGSSGVLHQAGSYGKAVVLPALGDLKELIEEEGYVGEYFEPGNVDSLSIAIEKLLINEKERLAQAQRNYAAASALPMSELADWYLLQIEKLTKKQVLGGQNLAKIAPKTVSGLAA